jgi:hypothetical protein
MIGANVRLSAENEDDDSEENTLPKINGEIVSHSKNIILIKKNLLTHELKYLSFLSSLRVFVNALREYKGGSIIT